MRRIRRQSSAEIDLTSLIDVLFILILFFVLSASFVQGALPVDLPDGRGSAPDARAIVITMSESGLRWADEDVPEALIIERALNVQDEKGVLILAAARTLPYGDVAAFLDRMRAAGVHSVSLALKGSDSKP
ncbi:MAG: biopolymer transporter ExbD [Pyramidobacter sp.]|nr:biopolymer transporter ExbD [Pyramidobacter sp.]